MGVVPEDTQQTPASSSPLHALTEESDMKTRVDAVWQKMNKGISTKTLNSILNKPSSSQNATTKKAQDPHNWMSVLGLGPKKTEPNGTCLGKTITARSGSSDEVKNLATAALAAAKDSAAASAAAQEKIEVTEVRDFAGEEIVVKRLVDPSSKEATDKAKLSASGVDAVLEQIKKRPKLNLLDKTKKDWGEFKDENKGLEEELDAYKKSSNQYIDKVSFLQQTDYREFEKERDARLAQQAKRKANMRED